MERALFEVFGVEWYGYLMIVFDVDFMTAPLPVTGEAQPFEGGSYIFRSQRRQNTAHKLTHISVI